MIISLSERYIYKFRLSLALTCNENPPFGWVTRTPNKIEIDTYQKLERKLHIQASNPPASCSDLTRAYGSARYDCIINLKPEITQRNVLKGNPINDYLSLTVISDYIIYVPINDHLCRY